MKTNKTVFGLLAFGPLVLIVISLTSLFAMIGIDQRGGGNDEELFVLFFFVAMIIVASILSIVSMIMYIMHISKNPRIPEEQRIAWILGMVLANGITNIIYFFVYIVKEEEYIAPQQSKSPWD